MQQLRLANVELRLLNEGDLELVRNWRNSAEVSQHMYTAPDISSEQQQDWFAKVQEDFSCAYWMILADEEPVGVANLANICLEHSRADWGFYLGAQNLRGKGIGSKVEYLILEYVFEELRLHKLCGEVFAFNTPVLKLHSKFGFQVEGTRRQHFFKSGKYQDVVEIALFRDTWEALRADLKRRCERL